MDLPIQNSQNTAHERRDLQREVFTVTMEYSLCGPTYDKVVGSEDGKALTINLSPGGIGFITDKNFIKGQCIILNIPQLSPEPLKTEVMWCGQRAKGLFDVGVTFH